MLKPRRTIAPVRRPVILDWVKDVARIDAAAEDAVTDVLVDRAIERIDGPSGILNRCLIDQTWVEEFDEFPANGVLRLSLEPLQSVTSIRYYDADNSIVTLATSQYAVHTDALGPFIYRPNGVSWPATYDRPDAVEVTTVYGYGENPDDVPATIRLAIAMMVTHNFENREQVVIGTIASEVPESVTTMLSPYSRVGF